MRVTTTDGTLRLNPLHPVGIGDKHAHDHWLDQPVVLAAGEEHRVRREPNAILF